MKVNEQATSKENTVGHDTNICYFLLHMLLLRLVITLTHPKLKVDKGCFKKDKESFRLKHLLHHVLISSSI